MQGFHTQGPVAVNSLRIPIVSIGADGLWIEETVDLACFRPVDGQSLPLERLGLSGDLSILGEDELLFRGSVKGVFSRPCDRCLAAAVFPFEVDVIWRFIAAAPGVAPEEGEDVVLAAEELNDPAMDYSFHGTEVDLTPALWEEAETALPAKFVCRADCRGLCPVCGGNLNETQCACDTAPEAEINPGLAGLKDLFPDLPEQRAEE